MCSSYCFCISARQLLLCIPSCFAHIPFYNAFPLSLPSNWPALSLPPSSSRCRCCTKQRSLAMGELWRLQGQTLTFAAHGCLPSMCRIIGICACAYTMYVLINTRSYFHIILASTSCFIYLVHTKNFDFSYQKFRLLVTQHIGSK